MKFDVCPNCKSDWVYGSVNSSAKCCICNIYFYSYSDKDKYCCWKDCDEYFIEWYSGETHCDVYTKENKASYRHIASFDYLLPFNITSDKIKIILMLM